MEIKRYNKRIKELISRLEMRYKFVSVFVQKKRKIASICSTKSNSILSLPEEIGFVVKAFNGSFFQEYASSVFDEGGIEEAERHLNDVHVNGGELSISDQPMIADFAQECLIVPTEQDLLAKALANRKIIEAESALIKNVQVNLSYEEREELYLSRGRELYQKLFMFENSYLIVLGEAADIKEIFGGSIKIGGFEHSDIDHEELKRDISIGERILGAKRLEPGYYDCIFSPSLSGMLAHEAFGHGTESDMFLKKRARGENYLGEMVASPLLTMWDSADMNNTVEATGSFFFDNEGTLAKRTLIIDRGRLVSGISDLYSSTKLGISLTSNSRAESYANKVYARMTNTCFELGNDRLEEMIKSVQHGYLLDMATNGMEDPKGWGMQLEALYAEEIREGALTGKVYGPVIITGYVPEVLKSVTHVSNDFKIASLGYCGKGHKEWVKVTDGGPYIKLRARLA